MLSLFMAFSQMPILYQYSLFLLGFGIFLLSIVFVMKGRILVGQSQVAIVERYKKFRKICYPGVNFINPLSDSLRVIHPQRVGMDRYFLDVRERILATPPQSVITEDNVNLKVDALLYLKIVDPEKAVYEIDDLEKSIQFLTISALRNILGDLTLDETLISREKVNQDLRDALDEAAKKWGVEVFRVEIKDFEARDEVHGAMQKQMQAERAKRAWILEAEGLKTSEILKAEGEQQASIIRAQGESEALLIRAKIQAEIQKIQSQAEAERIALIHEAMAKFPPCQELILLRYFESLEKIAQGSATKIFLPLDAPRTTQDLFKPLFSLETMAKENPAPPQVESSE